MLKYTLSDLGNGKQSYWLAISDTALGGEYKAEQNRELGVLPKFYSEALLLKILEYPSADGKKTDFMVFKQRDLL